MGRILLDVDGVVADLVGGICDELASEGYRRTPADFVRYEFELCVTERENAIARNAMAREGFCSRLPWYPSGRTFIECLQEFADVVAVTKPYPKGPTWAFERAEWLRPTLTRVVQTDVKECVAGDVLIEDYEVNAIAWLNEHPAGRAILMNRPWNRHVARDFHPRLRRAHSYGEAVFYAAGIVGSR